MSERGGYRCCVKGCQSATSNKRGIKETFITDGSRIDICKCYQIIFF